MAFIKWIALFVVIFFAVMWVARQTGQNLDSPWTIGSVIVISAAVVVGVWYKYMVDLLASVNRTPEIGLGANRTPDGQRISNLEREK